MCSRSSYMIDPMTSSLEEHAGAQLVFGMTGTTLTPDLIHHFKSTHAGGLILFRRNFESPDQLRRLISDFDQALGRRLLVCTDHEGGRVIMFAGGVTVFPSPQALGRTGQPPLARRQGEIEGRELRRLGIDVSFAPVLDVLTPAWSPNIGIRAYGSDPALVAAMGAARISALQVQGVSACAKHFPGLGAATRDPHVNLPTIPLSWDDMEKIHLVPFWRAMRTGVHSIMTSHPLYPALDPAPNTPATFSRVIVHDFLRKMAGYKGVIFSDDLEMGAITELCPIGEAAVKAVAAGHDMVLVCHSIDAQRSAFEALAAAYRDGRLDSAELDASRRRIQTLMEMRSERFSPAPDSEARRLKEQEDAGALVAEITRESVTMLRHGPALRKGPITAVIAPRLSQDARRIFFEEPLLEEAGFYKSQLKRSGLSGAVLTVGIDASDAEIQAAAVAAGGAEQTLLFLYDAHLIPAQKRLLDAVQANARHLVVVLLRDVYDAEWVNDHVLCLTNFGYRVCDLEAVFQKLETLAG